MATKNEVMAMEVRGEGALGHARDDEPVFVLRAADMLADQLVDEWATRASLLGCSGDKVLEAKRIAQDMREWPRRKNPD